MDKMCRFVEALKDLKLTREEVRKGMNDFELSVVSKKCGTTAIETRRLLEEFLKRNINIRLWRNENEIWSIRNGKRKQQKGFEGKGRKKIKEQNQKII